MGASPSMEMGSTMTMGTTMTSMTHTLTDAARRTAAPVDFSLLNSHGTLPSSKPPSRQADLYATFEPLQFPSPAPLNFKNLNKTKYKLKGVGSFAELLENSFKGAALDAGAG